MASTASSSSGRCLQHWNKEKSSTSLPLTLSFAYDLHQMVICKNISHVNMIWAYNLCLRQTKLSFLMSSNTKHCDISCSLKKNCIYLERIYRRITLDIALLYLGKRFLIRRDDMLDIWQLSAGIRTSPARVSGGRVNIGGCRSRVLSA